MKQLVRPGVWSHSQPKTHTSFASSSALKAKRRAMRLENKLSGGKPGRSGVCDICHEEKPLNQDHDHVTGKQRGKLCMGCNVSLGRFNDSPELLEKAAKYLREHAALAAGDEVTYTCSTL